MVSTNDSPLLDAVRTRARSGCPPNARTIVVVLFVRSCDVLIVPGLPDMIHSSFQSSFRGVGACPVYTRG